MLKLKARSFNFIVCLFVARGPNGPFCMQDSLLITLWDIFLLHLTHTTMTKEDFATALDILWHPTEGPKITTDQSISDLLGKALEEQGVQVIRVGRKPRSKNKFITFNLAVKKIAGMENMFLTEEDAQNWHDSKNRGLSTLMKAPDEAFDKVKTRISKPFYGGTKRSSYATV